VNVQTNIRKNEEFVLDWRRFFLNGVDAQQNLLLFHKNPL